MQEPPSDPWLDRLVVSTLSAVVLFGLGAVVALAVAKIDAPPSLTSLVAGAAGVLCGWFGRCKERSALHTPPPSTRTE